MTIRPREDFTSEYVARHEIPQTPEAIDQTMKDVLAEMETFAREIGLIDDIGGIFPSEPYFSEEKEEEDSHTLKSFRKWQAAYGIESDPMRETSELENPNFAKMQKLIERYEALVHARNLLDLAYPVDGSEEIPGDVVSIADDVSRLVDSLHMQEELSSWDLSRDNIRRRVVERLQRTMNQEE